MNYSESEVKQETNGAAGTSQSKAASSKRKAEPEDEPAAASSTSAKKRKTKGKEEDTMPLVERTATTALRKPMYIGVHVSAAGGWIPCLYFASSDVES